jgi:hypothetical protein
MAAGGLRDPEVLDELESHLRDAIEQRLNSRRDADPGKAFAEAALGIGPATELRHEFRKLKLIQHMKLETHKFLRAILVAIALFFVGLGLILPAAAKWRELGALDGYMIHFLIGAAMCVGSVAWGMRGVLEYRKVQ